MAGLFLQSNSGPRARRGGTQRGREVGFHLPPEPIHIQSAMGRAVGLHVRPARAIEPRCALEWNVFNGLRALSARRLDGRWRAGDSGDAWLRLPLHDPPALPTERFLVLLQRLPLGE